MQHLRGGHVSVASKQVICSTTEQNAVCFVSVADRGLRPKSRAPENKNASKVAGAFRFGRSITQQILYAGIPLLSIENWKVAGGRRHKIVIQRDGDSREAIGAGAEEGEEAEIDAG